MMSGWPCFVRSGVKGRVIVDSVKTLFDNLMSNEEKILILCSFS